jgi:hypothetical protein
VEHVVRLTAPDGEGGGVWDVGAVSLGVHCHVADQSCISRKSPRFSAIIFWVNVASEMRRATNHFCANEKYPNNQAADWLLKRPAAEIPRLVSFGLSRVLICRIEGMIRTSW